MIDEIESALLEVLPIYTEFIPEELVDQIIEIVKKLGIDLVRICIHEQRGDFETCIDIYLDANGCDTQGIFDWLAKLSKRKHTLREDAVQQIKDKILDVIEELVKANSIKTGEVIEMWLPNSQKDVIDKLGSNSELQLKYLRDFLSEREQEIKDSILSLNKDEKAMVDSQQYQKLLYLHVNLLAKQQSPDLKNVVMKEYYPINCLEGISGDSLIVKEAHAYLKKRSEMYSDSLKIFLGLMDQIKYDDFINEMYTGKSVSHPLDYFAE